MISIGSNNISKIYVGQNEVNKIYVGQNQVYSSSLQSGLYQNGVLVKSWAEIVEEYPDAFVTAGTISGSVVHSASYLTSLTGDLIIDNSISIIGRAAFYGCSGLTSVTVPDSVTIIRSDAFRDCTQITKLPISSTTTFIGDYVFVGCSNLGGTLTIPDSVTSIGIYAFYNLNGFTGELIIPNSVTSIGASAFRGCSGFTSITIGYGVTSIGDSAFRDCPNVETLNFNATNCSDFTADDIFRGLGTAVTTGTAVIIGDNVQRIPAYMFFVVSAPTKVTSVTIGNNVRSIEEGAFAYCTSLKSITIPANVIDIKKLAFANCSALRTANLYITSSLTKVTSYSNSWFAICNSALILHIPASVINPIDAYGQYWNYYSSTGTLTYIADL